MSSVTLLLMPIGWLVASSLQAQEVQSEPAKPGDQLAIDPLLVQPPKNREEDAARRRLAEERLEALRATTQPTTSPADEPAARAVEARQALYGEWGAYLAELERAGGLREGLASLQAEQHLQELTAKIQGFREKLGQLRRQRAPLTATDTEVADITALYKQLDAQLISLSEQQTRRAAQIATGFKQQHDALEAELKNLRQARQDLHATISAATATAPAERERLDLDLRRLNVQVARIELAIQGIALERQQTELLAQQEGPYLESLREYVVALRQRMTAMSEARGRSALEVLDLKRREATQVHDVAFLDLQYFRERLLLDHFQNRDLLNAIKDRYPESMLDRLRDRTTVSVTTWDETLASLDERTGQEAMDLRQEVRHEREVYEAELQGLRSRLGQSLAELQELRRLREKAIQRLRDLSEELAKALQSAEPSDRARIETEAVSLRSGLHEAMKATIGDAQELVTRLRDGVSLCGGHTATLRQLERSLYHIALTRRESGLAGLDWPAVRDDVRQLWASRTAPAAQEAIGAGLLGREALFPRAPAVSEQLRQRLQIHAEDLGALSSLAWALVALAAVVAGGLGLAAWNLARKRVAIVAASLTPVRQAGLVPDSSQRLVARAHLLTWKIVRDASIPLMVVLGFWAASSAAGLSQPTRAPIVCILGFALSAFVALMLVRHAFEPRDALNRILPCSDTVARHYRFWILAALVLSVLTLLPFLLLSLIGIAPATRALLWEFLKGGLLLLLLLFLIRKNRALGEPSTARNWLAALLSALYPLLLLAVLALLVLQGIGFGVLVGFIGGGVLATIATLLIAGAVVECLCELLDRLPVATRALPSHAASGRVIDAGAPSEADKGAAGPPQLSTLEHFVRLTKLLLRLAGLAVAIALIMRVWGIDFSQSAVNWSKVGFSVLVVVVALVVDRLVYSALYSLQVAGRVPASTSSIIRRWVRGALALLATLFIVAIAGYQIANIWTLMATVMAMVAVGFVAVWSVLSNIMSTLIILIWRPFNVGEEIDIQPEGIKGQVVDINFMYTVLKGEGNERTSVPNTLFLQKFIRRKPPKRRPRRSLAEQLEARTALDDPAPPGDNPSA